MHRRTLKKSLTLGAGLLVLGGAGIAHAGSITAVGSVQALTDVNQLVNVIATADYDDGVLNQNLPLGKYTPQGMTFYVGALASILPGVTANGSTSNPFYQNNLANFPGPIAGGGVAAGLYTYFGGAVKFDDNLTVTQFGLTAGRNGSQYLTVWDKSGVMLGQINWVPSSDAAFLGVDTMGVPIGMITYGNDDMWNGATYSVGGSTIMSDTWIWAKGAGCTMDAECADDDLCNGDETCTDGQCQAAAQPLDCDDQNVCTDDSCDAVLGCANDNNTAECDDGDACTETDVCAEGVCGGLVVECDDGDACTMDSCDMVNGCANDPIAGCCLGDDDCLDDEMCDLEMNVCEPLAPMTTTDGTTTGDTDGTTTDGTTTDGTTTDATTASTSDPTTSTTGETTGSTTSSTTADSNSDSASGTGATDTSTSATASGTSAATSDDGTTDGATSTDSSGVMDESGCGCATEGGQGRDVGGLLGLVGLVWIARRRRRAA